MPSRRRRGKAAAGLQEAAVRVEQVDPGDQIDAPEAWPIRQVFEHGADAERMFGIESYSYSGPRTQGAARYSYSYSNRTIMSESTFDHDRLDVYRLSIDYVASSYEYEYRDAGYEYDVAREPEPRASHASG